MSHITDVILLVSVLDEDVAHRVNEFFLTSGSQSGTPGQMIRVDEYASAGHKAMQATVYAGAFNYLDIVGFLRHVASLPWEDRSTVQVLLQDEHDDQFHLLGLDPLKVYTGGSPWWFEELKNS
jgi:hypothetical protein